MVIDAATHRNCHAECSVQRVHCSWLWKCYITQFSSSQCCLLFSGSPDTHQWLQCAVGMRDCALDWLSSCLTGHTQFVRYTVATSSLIFMSCGVLQWSVLVPVLFLLYVMDVIKLVEDCRLTPHTYTDDLQIYGHSTPTVRHLSLCLVQ